MQIKPRLHIVGAARGQFAQHVAGRHRSGDSIRNLAMSIGRSYGFIHALLEEAGCRAAGPQRRPPHPQAEPGGSV